MMFLKMFDLAIVKDFGKSAHDKFFKIRALVFSLGTIRPSTRMYGVTR